MNGTCQTGCYFPEHKYTYIKSMKTIACSVSSCVLNYDKIACEISIVYDAEKHQLLDTELDDLSVVK